MRERIHYLLGRAFLALCLLALLLFVYLLGTGPAVLFIARTGRDAEVMILYAPLDWACHHVPMLQRPLNLYLDLWDPE